MTTAAHSAALERVYAATTPGELAAAYGEWASAYDAETAALGYCLPFAIAAWLARHVPAGSGPVLDAGCGTGLTGPLLAALGYRDLAGLDLSPDMLAAARARGCYGDLRQAELGSPLPWPDGHFAAFVSAGVFTQGHAPAGALRELARVTRAGGHGVFTVRDTVLEAGGFRAVFAGLEAAGRWAAVEESPSFRAFCVGEPEVLVRAFVFRVTA
jgi:predicted TPR repeat methyltransferase